MNILFGAMLSSFKDPIVLGALNEAQNPDVLKQSLFENQLLGEILSSHFDMTTIVDREN